MKCKHLLLFALFIQLLILLHYSLISWWVSKPININLLLRKEIETIKRISPVDNAKTNGSLKGSVTEKPQLTVHIILDIQRNISIKLPVTSGVQRSSTNGAYGIKLMPQFNKFIFVWPMDSGLGNQMFRFAGLYAMGQLLGRSPVYVLGDTTVRDIEQEIASLFPSFYAMIHFIPPQNLPTRRFQLQKAWCDYQDPQILRNFSEPLLDIGGYGGNNFEHYKYFHNERNKISEIFNFSQETRKRVGQIASTLYGDNKSHKLCIHIRTGDFKAWHWESNPNTTSEAMRRIIENYMEKEMPYSLVFLGQDKEFFKQTALTEEQKRKVLVTPKNISRGDELCLGATTCDRLLITAPMSTYAFWIAYLMPENKPIYYLANYNNNTDLHSPGQFPSDWVPLYL